MIPYQRNIDVRHREMMLDLIRFYDDAHEADGIIYASAHEVEDIRYKARDLLTQLSAVTATWGLSDWERVLDLPPRPNSSDELRRSRIIAKLRGTAPATIANMLAIINAHVPQKDASIIELPEPGVVNVEIPVQNDLALNELHADINMYKPAHLTFLLHLTFATQNLTLSGFQYRYPIYYGKCGELVTYPILGVGFSGNIVADEGSYDYPIYYNPADTFNTALMAGQAMRNEFAIESHEYAYPNYYRATNTFNTDMLAGHLTESGGSIEQIANASIIPQPICGQFMTGGF